MDYVALGHYLFYPTSCIVPTLLSNLMDHLRLPMLRSNPFPHDVEALEGWFLAVPLERVFGRARSEIYGSLEVVSELIVEA